MPDSNLYGSPMKIIEYMACGDVVVAPNLPPIASLCTDGEDCLLFPKGDVDSLYSCINQLLDSHSLMDLFKTKAKIRAVNNYSWDARVEKIEQIIQRVIFN
jgi:glycosyltransferase involved in cell wall biosynthesis